MSRRQYRPRMLTPWAEDLIAVGGLLLVIGALGFLAIVGYSIEMGVGP